MKKKDAAYILAQYGHVREDYSGRYMYGETCVGVVLEDANAIYDIVADLAEQGHRVPPPKQDSMGLSTIFYWPDSVFDPDEPIYE